MIGRLRHRIELHSPTASRDSYGAQTETYAKYATVWGRIEPLRGLELIHAQEVQLETTHKCTIRYNSSVDGKDRIIFGTRTFEITSIINPEERNKYLEMWCKEVE